ncbi:MAG: HNH endonuclease [Planctomycetota bacterium]|nr:MAG: HNH endonuclease [Planctomycetota bacterium]
MTSWHELAAAVRARAGDRCEYCRMHQWLQGATLHVEHVVPHTRGGDDCLDNLAWACPGCNLRKSNRIEAIDPQSLQVSPLFHPRNHDWREHFFWDGLELRGLSGVGRATITALDLNHPRRIAIREAEMAFGLLSPDDDHSGPSVP